MAEKEPSERPTSTERPGHLATQAAPWDRTLESWNPITVCGLAAVGAAGGILLLLVGARSTARSAEFIGTPGFTLWAAVVAVQASMWAVVAAPLWHEVRSTYRSTRPSPSIWLIPALVVAALVLLVSLSPARETDWPLAGHAVKTLVLTVVAAGGVGVPALFGICVAQDGARRHQPLRISTEDIARALAARAQIQRLLGTAGAVIGLAVLASGALQRATVPQFLPEREFPPTAVLLYGGLFTALLLLVYVPAHLSLHRLCADIREHYFPLTEMPAPTSTDFAPWMENRNRLDALTQANSSAGQQLQASLFVLAPLLSGLLAALVPDIS